VLRCCVCGWIQWREEKKSSSSSLLDLRRKWQRNEPTGPRVITLRLQKLYESQRGCDLRVQTTMRTQPTTATDSQTFPSALTMVSTVHRPFDLLRHLLDPRLSEIRRPLDRRLPLSTSYVRPDRDEKGG